VGASISRLQRAGGDRDAAINDLLTNPNAAKHVAEARVKYANDPAGMQAWIEKKINETTKGKYSGVIGGVVKTVGKLAPLAAMIPGVGLPLAAGIGAAGGAISGGGVGGAVKGAGMAALGKLAKGAVPGGGGGGGGGDRGGFFDTIGGYAKDALSQLGGGNPLLGGASLVMGGLAANEASKQRKAVEAAANYRNQLLGRGLGQAEETYAAKAPLREGGMAAIGKYLANPRGLFQTPGEEGPAAPAPLPAPPPAMSTSVAPALTQPSQPTKSKPNAMQAFGLLSKMKRGF
jgi:hypothetical protein